MKWKNIIQHGLSKFGYCITKFQPGSEYTACPPYGYVTYSPWFGQSFQKIYRGVFHNTVVKEDRCYMLHKFAKHCVHLEGDLAECGTYRGGTAYIIAHAIKESLIDSKNLHLFDTFAGMPSTAGKKQDGHVEGDFGNVSLSGVKSYLSEFPYVIFHPGFIPETLKPVEDKVFCFAHIDVDIYQTTQDCCKFFYSRMVPGGIMIFDDYGFLAYKSAEKRAVDEFFGDKPESPISLRTGQCIVIKI